MENKIKHQEEIKKAKKSEKKLRQKEKKQSSKIAATIAVEEEAELFQSNKSKVDTAQKRSEAVKASDKLKDNENNTELKADTFIFKSEEPRFLDFPSSCADWSDDQK